MAGTSLSLAVGAARGFRAETPELVSAAFRLPAEERIRNALEGSRVPYPLYQMLRAEVPEDKDIYFLARQDRSSFRAYTALSSLLFPRVLLLVCADGPSWRPDPIIHPRAEFILQYRSDDLPADLQAVLLRTVAHARLWHLPRTGR